MVDVGHGGHGAKHGFLSPCPAKSLPSSCMYALVNGTMQIQKFAHKDIYIYIYYTALVITHKDIYIYILY